MREPSIASRTLRITLFASILGALFASVLAAAGLDVLIAEQADRRLRAATDTLSIELDEEDDESLDSTLDDENDEIATSGIRLAVYEDESLLAGARSAPSVEVSTCDTVSGMRSCAKRYGRWTLVAAQEDERQNWRDLLLGAVTLAVVLASLFSYFLSRKLASWAVLPLHQLSSALETIDARDPKTMRPWPARNIVEVRAIQDAIDRLLERVRMLLDRSERFSRDAAHELLTPLTVISTKLQLLAETDEVGVSAQSELTGAVQRLHQLSRLVDGLLLLGTDAEISRRVFEPVSLDDSIGDVIASLEPELQPRVILESTSEGLVLGEPELIRGAIRNGINNALKFSTHQVRVGVEESADEVLVYITDDGPGVPSSLHKRVLDPFFRATADSAPGHGLGLAIVAHVMAAHRGSVRFEEALTGARLVLSFPRWASPSV